MKHRITALITSGILLVSGISAMPVLADDITKSVTVTVYDAETGALMDVSGLSVELIWTKQPQEWNSSGLSFGSFQVSQENPHTFSDVSCKDEGSYLFGLPVSPVKGIQYTIDEERSDWIFTFDENAEFNAKLYIKHRYAEGVRDGIFVCCGKTDKEGYPVFEQYYPAAQPQGTFRHRTLYYPGTIDPAPVYGDIMVTDDVILPNGRMLDASVTFTKLANCADLEDIREVTVGYVAENSTDSRLVILDESGTAYNFNANYANYTPDISVAGTFCGDTIKFAFYENIPILPLSVPVHHHPEGDVNGNNMLRPDDAVQLQQWLLCQPDAAVADRTAGDLSGDGALSAKDLSLLKQALIHMEQQPHCTLILKTHAAGYGEDGTKLPDAEYETGFLVYEGDWFSEGENGWVQNSDSLDLMGGRILEIKEITDEAVTAYEPGTDTDYTATEKTLKFGESAGIASHITVYDGYNSSYTVSFTKDKPQPSQPDNMPAISEENGAVPKQVRKALWNRCYTLYPDSDLSDFTLRYDPDHKLNDVIYGAHSMAFTVLYRGIPVTDGWCNTHSIAAFVSDGTGACVNLGIRPEEYAQIDTTVNCLSADEIIANNPEIFEGQQIAAPELVIYISAISDNIRCLAYQVYDPAFELFTFIDAVNGNVLEQFSLSVPETESAE